MRRLLLGLQVFPERMQANLDASHGLVFSQPVLLALGAGWQEPRRGLPDRARQRHAGVGRGHELSLSCSKQDDRVTVAAAVLDSAFDVHRSLQHVHRVFDAMAVDRCELDLGAVAGAATNAGRFEHAGIDPDGAPRGVADAVASAVDLGHCDELGFERRRGRHLGRRW